MEWCQSTLLKHIWGGAGSTNAADRDPSDRTLHQNRSLQTLCFQVFPLRNEVVWLFFRLSQTSQLMDLYTIAVQWHRPISQSNKSFCYFSWRQITTSCLKQGADSQESACVSQCSKGVLAKMSTGYRHLTEAMPITQPHQHFKEDFALGR